MRKNISYFLITPVLVVLLIAGLWLAPTDNSDWSALGTAFLMAFGVIIGYGMGYSIRGMDAIARREFIPTYLKTYASGWEKLKNKENQMRQQVLREVQGHSEKGEIVTNGNMPSWNEYYRLLQAEESISSLQESINNLLLTIDYENKGGIN